MPSHLLKDYIQSLFFSAGREISTACGGIGLIHQLAQRFELAKEIDQRLSLFKITASSKQVTFQAELKPSAQGLVRRLLGFAGRNVLRTDIDKARILT